MAEEQFIVWRRSDGFVASSVGNRPVKTWDPEKRSWVEAETLLITDSWPAARSRIRAERVAIVMNEDLVPIAESAESNRFGVDI